MSRSPGRSGSRLALVVLALAGATQAAPPQSKPLDRRAIDLPAPDLSVLVSRCAHPFEDRGQYRIPAGYSGEGASSKPIPTGKFLQLRSVAITLDEADWRGAHLGAWTHGEFAWYPLRLQGGAAIYQVDVDGPLYVDGGGGTFKFVSYRAQGYDRPASGTYVLRGCLVDRIPAWVTVPDMRVPRYPKKRLTPLEPVEMWDGVRQAPERPGG